MPQFAPKCAPIPQSREKSWKITYFRKGTCLIWNVHRSSPINMNMINLISESSICTAVHRIFEPTCVWNSSNNKVCWLFKFGWHLAKIFLEKNKKICFSACATWVRKSSDAATVRGAARHTNPKHMTLRSHQEHLPTSKRSIKSVLEIPLQFCSIT